MKLRNSISVFSIWLIFFNAEEKKIMAPPVKATTSVTADEFCGGKNTAFQAGEQVTFHVFYSVVGTYIHAGTATFTTTLENFSNKPVYHIVGDGKTKSSYDWIYKVRDKYETYIDTATLQPMKFIRNVDEGGYKKYETVTFNKTAKTAVTNGGVFKIPDCISTDPIFVSI